MKKLELLSPAGSMESLKAAISAGCDAVYLGGYTFGARNYASNFSDQELIDAINYAHVYGVKVYVTVNTMIYEDETDRFIQYVDFLHQNNVDAVIIQDLGMMNYLRKTYPNLEIHASTQMNVHNVEGAKFLEKLGVKRVVLARETSIEVIKEIKKQTNIEIEIFIQGALCLSYSGQCLMSSLLGGRSGNRGTCSQCCRMQYDLFHNDKKINKDQYLLSTKDLNTLEYIKELVDIGVDSFKIEGRMKRPEYVYLMTNIYRKAIDGNLDSIENSLLEMKKIFNREFTKGFLFHEKNNNFINPKRPNHIGIPVGTIVSCSSKFTTIELTNEVIQEDGIRILNKKEDVGFILNKIYLHKKLVNSAKKGDIIEVPTKGFVQKGDLVLKTTDKKQMLSLQEQMKNTRKIDISMDIVIHKNEPISLSISDFNHKITVKSDYIVEEFQNLPTPKARIIEQFKKLGDTPFTLKNIQVDYEDSFVKISEINEIRRRAVQELIQARQYKIPYVKNTYEIDLPNYSTNRNISVMIRNLEDYHFIQNKKLDSIYMKSDIIEKIQDHRKVLKIPRVNFNLKEIQGKVLISDLGSLEKYKQVITDFGFNVANSYTVAFLHSLGVLKVTLSYELTKEQIKNIIEAYHKRYCVHPNLEVIVSSYPEVMISKFRLLDYFHVHNGKNYLKDKHQHQFKIEETSDIMTIYHFEKIKLDSNSIFELGINNVRIHIEDNDDINTLK